MRPDHIHIYIQTNRQTVSLIGPSTTNQSPPRIPTPFPASGRLLTTSKPALPSLSLFLSHPMMKLMCVYSRTCTGVPCSFEKYSPHGLSSPITWPIGLRAAQTRKGKDETKRVGEGGGVDVVPYLIARRLYISYVRITCSRGSRGGACVRVCVCDVQQTWYVCF